MMPLAPAPHEPRVDSLGRGAGTAPATAVDEVAVATATVAAAAEVDPGLVITSCANCGATMTDRKCKLVCSCGYFLSCSDYY